MSHEEIRLGDYAQRKRAAVTEASPSAAAVVTAAAAPVAAAAAPAPAAAPTAAAAGDQPFERRTQGTWRVVGVDSDSDSDSDSSDDDPELGF